MSGGGRRKDGKPYKDGNTREDGSYSVGKNRTPEHTRFAENDGRRRGSRAKGARNFDSDWEEELNKRVSVNRGGKTMKVSAHHAQVMKTLEMGSKGKERSQELIFRKAERLQERKKASSSRSDDELIAEWLAQQQMTSDGPSIVGDDLAAENGDASDHPENEEPDSDPTDGGAS